MQEITYRNEVVTIKLFGKNKLQGIIVNSGKKWTLLKYIAVDYLIDGLIFVNNKFIKRISKTEDDTFKEKVLRAKKVDFEMSEIINLDNHINLFSSFLLNKKALQIELNRNDVIYVGTVGKINDKSVRLKQIDTKAEDTYESTYNFDVIRLVSIDNDYVSSLMTFKESEYFSK